MSLTDKVIMPGADYQAICDAVREKNASTDLLKSGEIAPAILSNGKPVYKTIDGIPYRRTFHDDFDSGDINHNYWSEDYHPSRANPAYFAYSDVRQENGNLVVRLKKNQPKREGTDTTLAVSGVMSGKWNGMHLADTIYHDFRPWYGVISQEGYYELRAKMFSGNGTHAAWWGIGCEDKSNQKAEIDIFEISGARLTNVPYNLHPNGDTTITKTSGYFNTDVNLSEDFHTYGLLWENGVMKFYFDGVEKDSWEVVTPQYPFIWYINAYRCTEGTYWGGTYDPDLGDIELLVDYFSIYKKANSVLTEPPTIVSYSPTEISFDGYTVEDNTGKLAEMPLYCYLNWSDGSRTEHWVKWDIFESAKQAILDAHGTVDWTGIVYGVGIEISCAVTNSTVTRYTVTNNLTNATTSNSASSVAEGGTYSATITPVSGYDISEVTVTMGGVDITSEVYSNGTISIEAVTGDITIIVSTVRNEEEPVVYTVTNNLTNATSDNSATTAEENSAYTATITANDGYELNAVTVTMGGVDITASAYSDGVITIPAVTGNVVVTASAISIEEDEPYDGYDYDPLDGVTWMAGKAYSSTTGALVDSANQYSTEKFAVKDCTYVVSGDGVNDYYISIHAWDENDNYLGVCRSTYQKGADSVTIVANSNYKYAIRLNNTTGAFDSSTVSMVAQDNSERAVYRSITLANMTWTAGTDATGSGDVNVVKASFRMDEMPSPYDISKYIDSANVNLFIAYTQGAITGTDKVFKISNSGTTITIVAYFDTVDAAVAYFTENNSVLEFNVRQKTE